MRIILQTLFIIILANILSAQDPVDTTIVISGLSDISALDSKYPLIGNISPNSGESYNSGENISVIWDASDDSFTDNCISIFISYNLGENFNNIFENINNVGQTNYQLADINSQFVRLKITADDYYGNSSTLFGENYFTVGYDPDWDFEPPDWQDPEEPEVDGCTDSEACNYNEDANQDDGSCIYPFLLTCYQDTDGDGFTDEQSSLNGCECPLGWNETPAWDVTETEVFFDSSFVSGVYQLDSKYPLLDILDPNGGEVFDSGQNINVNWQADDHTFTEEAISIYFSEDLGYSFNLLYDNIANSNTITYDLPEINSAFARFKLSAIDSYGNQSIDIADNYFQIGIIDTFYSDFTFDPSSSDTIPDGFSFTDATGVELGTLITSNAVNITGIEESVTASVSGQGSPQISIAGGSWETSGTLNPGETIQVSLTSSAIFETTLSATVTVGSVSDIWYVTTIAQDAPFSYDTTFSFINLSDIGILDSDYPYIEWLYPNGGEQFDNFETVTVEWSADDESFGDEAISIYLSTQLGGYYNSVAEGVPNTESLDIDLPSADEAFARFKATATDLFGNTSEDHEDNYFILGDPFGEYNVNPLDDIVVIDWGWGEYQMIYVENDALDFLNEGDEIHVIDQNGIITEDCVEEAYGVVSVASLPYFPESNTPYGLYSIGGVNYCEQSEYIAPGYVEGNPINFAHYDESESTLNYLEPEYDSGNGLFGVEFEDTLRFQYFDESENLVYDLYETIIFSPDMIEGNAIIPVQFTVNYSTETSGTPDWEINIHDYEFNGSITSAVYEMGELITNPGDRIAAFVNNVCRGTIDAVETPDPIFEEVVFHLMVYGNLPITIVTSFTESVARSSDLEIMYSASNRELNQFNVYRNSELVGPSINDFYYMDESTQSGEDYCYQIMLLDDEGNELLESMEQCIGIGEEIEYILGDVTQDGSVNVLDIVMLVDWILSGTSLSDLEITIADMTNDGLVNVLDIVALVNIILGN